MLPLTQTDDGQLHLALIVAAANDGAVSVLILGIGHSAFRGDQVDAADGIIQHAAAVIAQVEHKALGTAGSERPDGIVQLAGRSAVELADADIAHIVQQL